MSNARFSVIQSKAVKDKRISDAQFRTLAALGMYADEDGWCFPSLTTLGNDLGKTKQATGRDTISLKKLGYLETQARYNKDGSRRSNLYRLKFDFPITLPRQPDVDAPSTPDVDVNVSTTTSEVQKNIFTLYESNIGILTPMIASLLQDAEKVYPETWIIEAFQLSVENNKRNWRYCEAILKRWKTDGKDEGKGKPVQEKKQTEYQPVPVRVGVPRPANIPAPKIGVTK